MLIMIYLISRWLQPGGIVLIDEPDLYLHPSLVSGLLANLERLVAGQAGTTDPDLAQCRYLAAIRTAGAAYRTARRSGMSKLDTLHDKIKQQHVGATGKRFCWLRDPMMNCI